MHARNLMRAAILVSLFAVPADCLAQAAALDGRVFVADAGVKGKDADEKGDAIEGTFVHYRKGWLLNPNPEPIEHWFRGQAKR